MKTIAIITARGGSKRIPKKNIKEFCGKPIIAYSINAALESEIFDEVMVSTDSQEIADVAKEYGANVPFFRSEQASNDFATTNDVLHEVLEKYFSLGMRFDCMCCLYPTAPFVSAHKLSVAYELIENGAKSVMPVVRYGFPPQRGMVIYNGALDYKYKQFSQMRSQDLEPIYHDCGQFYFYRLYNNLSFIDGNYAPIIFPESEVQDIDNLEDWNIAEMKYRLMQESEGK